MFSCSWKGHNPSAHKVPPCRCHQVFCPGKAPAECPGVPWDAGESSGSWGHPNPTSKLLSWAGAAVSLSSSCLAPSNSSLSPLLWHSRHRAEPENTNTRLQRKQARERSGTLVLGWVGEVKVIWSRRGMAQGGLKMGQREGCPQWGDEKEVYILGGVRLGQEKLYLSCRRFWQKMGKGFQQSCYTGSLTQVRMFMSVVFIGEAFCQKLAFGDRRWCPLLSRHTHTHTQLEHPSPGTSLHRSGHYLHTGLMKTQRKMALWKTVDKTVKKNFWRMLWLW